MDSAAEEIPARDLLSKADFIHSVETLAGDASKPAITVSGNDDMVAVCVSCPYTVWKQSFGEPRDIEEHSVVAGHTAVRAWEQPCRDGTVHCVGYFVDEPRDGPCVVLTRVCLF